MEDTIASISTALGISAISIVRVSGQEAVEVVNKIFKKKDLTKVKTHTIHYGYIYNEDGIIDEVLVTVMRGPKTFTKEDIVEINCHGGIATTQKVLEQLLLNGARMAEPGEFTKRAFLNGRIDLVEAEGVIDLIEAKTDKARKLALNQIDGKTSNLIKELRGEIMDILTNIEVNIDYPEYEDVLVITNQMIKKNINKIEKKLRKVLKESQNSKIIKEGLKVLIVGKPNVGKSSLLNKMIDEEKAIVTEIEGTTRDIVEGTVNLDGIIINLIDTAGIRTTDNKVEKIGVKKSLELIKKVDLIIVVLNNNEEITFEDQKILKETKNKKRIIFVNKIDLVNKLNIEKFNNEEIIEGSTVLDKGIDKLKNKIKKMFNFEEIETGDFNYLTNARQIAIMRETLKTTQELEVALKNNIPIDILEIDIKKIWELLGEIIGERFNDQIIDQIFKKFCLGK